MNKVILMGNLCRDPELKAIPSGKNVCTCSLATNESYTDAAGVKQQVAEFHNLVIWMGAENFAKYLSKGSKVLIVGKLKTSDWTGEDGVKKYKTDIVVNEFTFLDSKPRSEGEQPATQDDHSQPEPAGEEQIKVEDIPF